MIVVLVSGVFCQTFSTASGKSFDLSTLPVISADSLIGVNYTVITVLSDPKEDITEEVIEIDGQFYIVK
jgi:hypothetical protein